MLFLNVFSCAASKITLEIQEEEPIFVSYVLLYLNHRMKNSVSAIYQEYLCPPGANARDMIVEHLSVLEVGNVECLVHLVTLLLVNCPDLSYNNIGLIHLLVSNIDGSQLQYLVSQVISQNLRVLPQPADCLQLLGIITRMTC